MKQTAVEWLEQHLFLDDNWKKIFEQAKEMEKNQNLNISDVISSSNHFDEEHNKWCKVFDDMMESPYIDMYSIRELDRIAILSWLSSNYKSPVKRDKPNY